MLDQKLRSPPFKSSIYIKGLGAPPSTLADLYDRLAGQLLVDYLKLSRLVLLILIFVFVSCASYKSKSNPAGQFNS